MDTLSEEDLSSEVSRSEDEIPADVMRSLVSGWLSHNCYTETLRAFHRDTGRSEQSTWDWGVETRAPILRGIIECNLEAIMRSLPAEVSLILILTL
jgi:hypothetical protein